MKTAIYHFTQNENKEYQKVLADFKKYANDQNMIISKIFLDNSPLRYRRKEFDNFLSSNEDYNALIVKDFYHISKNTMKCMSILKDMQNRGIDVHSLNDGIIKFFQPDFNKPLRVATYSRHLGVTQKGNDIIPLKNDILNLFIKKETNWSLVDQYSDESNQEKYAAQLQLIDLIKNKDKYDLIVVHNLNDLNWRTAKFIKVMNDLNLDVYSLQEGLIKITRSD